MFHFLQAAPNASAHPYGLPGVDFYTGERLGMGSTGSGGRASACSDVWSRASGYPATEHARPEPFSDCVVDVTVSAR